MGIFDNILGNWIQVIDKGNKLTIADYGYDTGVIEGTTGNHCVKCVAVNQCCFKDEKNKKPEKFNLTGISILDSLLNGLSLELYHFKCHCSENPINFDNENEIELIIPDGKIDYLFSSKSGWINAMGYRQKDYNNFVEILLQKSKEAYFYGKYYIENISKYGCKINLQIDMPGANEKEGKVYGIESNYMIFPNGKLKMNTPIGGWQE